MEYYGPTRTFKGTISYGDDSLEGVNEVYFVMTFSKDFSFIESGYKTTNLDDNKTAHLFGKNKEMRYRRYEDKYGVEQLPVPEW